MIKAALLSMLAIVTPEISQPISSQKAASMVGQTVDVLGMVSQVMITNHARVLLMLDGKWPRQAFVLAVHAPRADQLDKVEDLLGAQVETTGVVTIQPKWGSAIIVIDPSQLLRK